MGNPTPCVDRASPINVMSRPGTSTNSGFVSTKRTPCLKKKPEQTPKHNGPNQYILVHAPVYAITCVHVTTDYCTEERTVRTNTSTSSGEDRHSKRPRCLPDEEPIKCQYTTEGTN